MGRKRKVVFVVETKFQERDFRRYGIELIESNGFEVEVWECSGILHPDYSKTYLPPDPHQSKRLVEFYSYKALKARAKTLSKQDTIIQPRIRGKKYHQLLQSLMAGESKYGQIDFGLQPGHNTQWKKSAVRRLFDRGVNFFREPTQIAEKVYHKLPDSWKGLRSFDFLILGGGSQIQNRNYEISENITPWVWTHTLDYDLYLDLKSKGSEEPKHIVYLDSYLPFHPTWTITGESAPVTPDQFYPKLRKLFEQLEEQLQLPVVVAAHPRSKYGEMEEDFFGGRTLHFGKTAELVKNARLSIGHFSTSNSYNVLFGKPVICVTSNQLEASRFQGYVGSMAEMLGSKPLNLDIYEGNSLPDYFEFSSAHYDKFKEDFVKRSGTPDISSWQIVSDFIKNKL